MTIKYYRKNVYGNTLRYLVDDEAENALEVESIKRLIGQKTISEQQMELFKNIGIEFEEVIAPIK